RLTAGLSSEINLEMIAEILDAVDSHPASKDSKFPGDGFRDSIHGRFVVTGRFDLDQLADARDNLIAPLLEVVKPRLRLQALDRAADDGRCLVGFHVHAIPHHHSTA